MGVGLESKIVNCHIVMIYRSHVLLGPFGQYQQQGYHDVPETCAGFNGTVLESDEFYEKLTFLWFQGWNIKSIGCGHRHIAVSADDNVIVWGIGTTSGELVCAICCEVVGWSEN